METTSSLRILVLSQISLRIMKVVRSEVMGGGGEIRRFLEGDSIHNYCNVKTYVFFANTCPLTNITKDNEGYEKRDDRGEAQKF